MKLTKILLLSLCLLNINAKTKLGCVVEELFKEINVPHEVKEHMVRVLNEQNMSRRLNTESSELADEFFDRGLALRREIESMLRDFTSQPAEFQRAVEKCELSMEAVKNNCQSRYKEGCESVDKYTLSRKCPENHFRFNYQYCVPLCDEELRTDDDVFVCGKGIKNTNTKQLDGEYWLKTASYRELFSINLCPEGFVDIGPGLCIKTCPFGWEDIGEKCLKPKLKERKYDTFTYSFELEDDSLQTMNF